MPQPAQITPENRRHPAPRRRARCRSRRGLATMWLIISGPALLTLLLFVADVANIWLARVELENGIESATLAGVKHWGDNSFPVSTAASQAVAEQYAAANTVIGVPIDVSNPGVSLTFTFAKVTNSTSPYTLDPNQPGSCAAGENGGAIFTEASMSVQSMCDNLFGVPLGPYTVQATTTARYNCTTSPPRPELIRIVPLP